MSNSRFLLTSAAAGGVLCGFVGVVIGAITGAGTSILLPGLGLVVSGSLALAVAFGFLGVFLGSMLGLVVAAIIIFNRRKNFP
ncbi:MAG: hypothetical protein M3Q99_17670 [Acidobacteriota bacterium]|nr:hypothetical protein [Acidobacteriota bacterium]